MVNVLPLWNGQCATQYTTIHFTRIYHLHKNATIWGGGSECLRVLRTRGAWGRGGGRRQLWRPPRLRHLRRPHPAVQHRDRAVATALLQLASALLQFAPSLGEFAPAFREFASAFREFAPAFVEAELLWNRRSRLSGGKGKKLEFVWFISPSAVGSLYPAEGTSYLRKQNFITRGTEQSCFRQLNFHARQSPPGFHTYFLQIQPNHHFIGDSI